jgi:hypothetical protein
LFFQGVVLACIFEGLKALQKYTRHYFSHFLNNKCLPPEFFYTRLRFDSRVGFQLIFGGIDTVYFTIVSVGFFNMQSSNRQPNNSNLINEILRGNSDVASLTIQGDSCELFTKSLICESGTGQYRLIGRLKLNISGANGTITVENLDNSPGIMHSAGYDAISSSICFGNYQWLLREVVSEQRNWRRIVNHIIIFCKAVNLRDSRGKDKFERFPVLTQQQAENIKARNRTVEVATGRTNLAKTNLSYAEFVARADYRGANLSSTLINQLSAYDAVTGLKRGSFQWTHLFNRVTFDENTIWGLNRKVYLPIFIAPDEIRGINLNNLGRYWVKIIVKSSIQNSLKLDDYLSRLSLEEQLRNYGFTVGWLAVLNCPASGRQSYVNSYVDNKPLKLVLLQLSSINPATIHSNHLVRRLKNHRSAIYSTNSAEQSKIVTFLASL